MCSRLKVTHYPEERKQNVYNISIPTTVKQRKSFLGVANYFLEFIPNLSSLLAPLTDLTKGLKKGVISWSPEAQVAFDTVKQAVVTAQSLTWPNDSDPFILYTDASDIGVGAILVQLQGNVEKPIGCYSRKFTETAQRWSTIEKGFFSLFSSVLYFQSYLLGRTFCIRTDHGNLVYMHNSVVPKAIRWRLCLLEFSFIIIHIPGEDNVVADHLSRSFFHRATGEGITMDEKIARIQSVHNEIVGHHGIGRTLDMLTSAELAWDGMKKDVVAFINSCLICQKIKSSQHLFKGPSDYHLHGTYPMSSLSCDALGPLPTDDYGNVYILGIIDNFSKFIQLFAIKITEAKAYITRLV